MHKILDGSALICITEMVTLITSVPAVFTAAFVSKQWHCSHMSIDRSLTSHFLLHLSILWTVCLQHIKKCSLWWCDETANRLNKNTCCYCYSVKVTGDRLWMGKPPRRRTRHPGLLSPSLPIVAGWYEYPVNAGGVNRHIAWYTSPYPWSCSVVLNAWLNGLASGYQRRLNGKQ